MMLRSPAFYLFIRTLHVSVKSEVVVLPFFFLRLGLNRVTLIHKPERCLFFSVKTKVIDV